MDEKKANDLLQAVAFQRNQHADDAAALYAETMELKRKIAELEGKLKEQHG